MASFKDWWVGKLITAFLNEPHMQTFARALGDFADAIEAWVDNAVKQRFPRLASKGGRAALGDERGLSRPLNSTEAQYAEKVQNAWVLWPKAGTPLGLLRALRDEGYNVELVTKLGRHYTLSIDGNSVSYIQADPWTFQSGRTLWNTFALVVRPPYPSGAVPLRSSGEGVAFLATVEKWRFGNALLGEVVWVPSGLTWGTFPAGATWAAQGRPTWDSGYDAGLAVWTF
jgi:hypothetical protein